MPQPLSLHLPQPRPQSKETASLFCVVWMENLHNVCEASKHRSHSPGERWASQPGHLTHNAKTCCNMWQLFKSHEVSFSLLYVLQQQQQHADSVIATAIRHYWILSSSIPLPYCQRKPIAWSKIVFKALRIQDFTIYDTILALRNWINWTVYWNFNHHFKVNNLITL